MFIIQYVTVAKSQLWSRNGDNGGGHHYNSNCIKRVTASGQLENTGLNQHPQQLKLASLYETEHCCEHLFLTVRPSAGKTALFSSQAGFISGISSLYLFLPFSFSGLEKVYLFSATIVFFSSLFWDLFVSYIFFLFPWIYLSDLLIFLLRAFVILIQLVLMSFCHSSTLLEY